MHAVAAGLAHQVGAVVQQERHARATAPPGAARRWRACQASSSTSFSRSCTAATSPASSAAASRSRNAAGSSAGGVIRYRRQARRVRHQGVSSIRWVLAPASPRSPPCHRATTPSSCRAAPRSARSSAAGAAASTSPPSSAAIATTAA